MPVPVLLWLLLVVDGAPPPPELEPALELTARA